MRVEIHDCPSNYFLQVVLAGHRIQGKKESVPFIKYFLMMSSEVNRSEISFPNNLNEAIFRMKYD